VAHLTVGVPSQFLQPANGDHEGRIDRRHHKILPLNVLFALLLYRNSDASELFTRCSVVKKQVAGGSMHGCANRFMTEGT
jgi:hypothetical protein